MSVTLFAPLPRRRLEKAGHCVAFVMESPLDPKLLSNGGIGLAHGSRRSRPYGLRPRWILIGAHSTHEGTILWFDADAPALLRRYPMRDGRAQAQAAQRTNVTKLRDTREPKSCRTIRPVAQTDGSLIVLRKREKWQLNRSFVSA